MVIKSILFCAAYGYLVIESMACNPNCSAKAQYNANGAYFSISPSLDSIPVEDTLQFYCSFPTAVKYKNGTSVDSPSVDLRSANNVVTEFHIDALKQPHVPIGAIDSFQYIIDHGTFLNQSKFPELAKGVSFSQLNDSFVLSFKFVAIKKGIYGMALLDIPNAEVKCGSASIEVMVANSDTHLHYLQDIFYNGDPVAPVDVTHSYCVKVY
jgi:hypothetical protein